MDRSRIARERSKPEIGDDLETAQAKSGSVDERIPEHYAVDDSVGRAAGAPVVPQSGIGVPAPGVDLGEGERVLEQERKAQRTPKSPG